MFRFGNIRPPAESLIRRTGGCKYTTASEQLKKRGAGVAAWEQERLIAINRKLGFRVNFNFTLQSGVYNGFEVLALIQWPLLFFHLQMYDSEESNYDEFPGRVGQDRNTMVNIRLKHA